MKTVSRPSSTAVGDHRCHPGFILVRRPHLEVFNRAADRGFVHLGHFEALADAAQQRDVQLAAQMLAELAEPVDQREAAIRSRSSSASSQSLKPMASSSARIRSAPAAGR